MNEKRFRVYAMKWYAFPVCPKLGAIWEQQFDSLDEAKAAKITFQKYEGQKVIVDYGESHNGSYYKEARIVYFDTEGDL